MKGPLDPYRDAQGRLTRLPRKAVARAAALDFLADGFAHGRGYSEAEVGAVLADRHGFGDPALLRRELFDGRRLTRTADGRVYHRLCGTAGPLSLRHLDRAADADVVAEVLEGVGDYIRLERGRGPVAADVAEVFDLPEGVPETQGFRLLVLDAERRPRGLVAGFRGAAGLRWGPGTWMIGDFWIDVRARGQGYGAAVLGWLAGEATAAGATRLRLGVIEANRRGRAFWEREGFAPTGELVEREAGLRTNRVVVLERPLP